MTDINNVCVYCGSSSNVDDAFKEGAVQLGKEIAKQKWGVVYGGGDVGLMGLVANSALEAGGDVIGIIPEHISSREVQHTSLTELHVVDTMHVRKQMMVDKSEAFVILPGGIGTMDEFFELVTWKQLGLHDKPIVIVNLNGYWTKLIELVTNIANEGFMRQEDLTMYHVVDKIEDVVETLKNAPAQKFDPTTKWI